MEERRVLVIEAPGLRGRTHRAGWSGFVSMAEPSGPQRVLGQEQYDGVMLAVERYGGKLGGVPVQVFRKDSQLNSQVAVQLTQKLIEKD